MEVVSDDERGGLYSLTTHPCFLLGLSQRQSTASVVTQLCCCLLSIYAPYVLLSIWFDSIGFDSIRKGSDEMLQPAAPRDRKE